jgi:protein SCO1/2
VVRRRAAALALLLTCALLPAGCSGDRHTGRGVVRDVQRGNAQVVIEHGDIEGLMPAMTMNFEVPDPALLASLQRGQVIDFTVHFTGKSYRVVEATVVGEDTGVGGAFPDVVAPRDPAPEFSLTDQAGQPVSLASLRGKTLLLDFVYTSCPGPCPILTSRHARLQRELPEALREKVWFVSISLDPAVDTPEALHAYAQARGADLARWSFLTGEPAAVAEVVKAYGVGSLRQPDGEIDHLVVTFLIDREGRIAERYTGLEHETADLLRDLERIAAG